MSAHSMPVPRVLLPVILAMCLLALGLTLLMTWGSGGVAHGATLTVTSLSDSGAGTLRQAIFDSSGGDTIDFAVTGTIILNSGQLVIDKSLTIQGPGSGDLSISGNNAFRVIHVQAGNVSISGVTIQDGNDSGEGGGVLISDGDVQMSGVTIRDNHAGIDGGGVYTEEDAALTITESLVSDNRARGGGGIDSRGTAEIYNSVIARNHATSAGGGINVKHRTVRVVSSTVVDNTSDGCGGGISRDALGFDKLELDSTTVSGNEAEQDGGGLCLYGPAEITNSTISGNTAGTFAGGIEVSGSGEINMTFSTVKNNTATHSGGVYFQGADVPDEIGNSIVAGNTATGLVPPGVPDRPDCGGNVTSLGHNLIGDDSGCNYVAAAGDLVNVDPLLAARPRII